jgi:hypothetical protein
MTTNALPELEKLVESAPDPIRMRQQLTGWLSVNHKPLDGELNWPSEHTIGTRVNSQPSPVNKMQGFPAFTKIPCILPAL